MRSGGSEREEYERRHRRQALACSSCAAPSGESSSISLTTLTAGCNTFAVTSESVAKSRKANLDRWSRPVCLPYMTRLVDGARALDAGMIGARMPLHAMIIVVIYNESGSEPGELHAHLTDHRSAGDPPMARC